MSTDQRMPGDLPVEGGKLTNNAQENGSPGQSEREPVTGSEGMGREGQSSAIGPVPRPRTGNVVTERQERALRYLEMKRTRQERISQPDGVEDEDGLAATDKVPALGRRRSSYLPAVATTPSNLVVTDRARILRNRRRRKMLVHYLSRKNMRRARDGETQSFNRFWLVLISTVLAVLIVFLSVTGASLYAGYQFANNTQNQYKQKLANLRDLVPRDNLKMYDSRGTLLGQLRDEGLHTTVPLNDIPKNLVNATVAVEDKNFWTNPGIDVLRIIQAALGNLRAGRVVEGGSTITQQLIKIFVVGGDTSIQRKLEEIVLTPEVNRRYSKEDIMEMYLNSINYGNLSYGINAAATTYFGLEDKPGKPAASQLTLAQSAMLAGFPNSPEYNNPKTRPENAYARFNIVLDLMFKQGYITKVEVNQAKKEAAKKDFFKFSRGQYIVRNRAPHFFDFVIQELQKQYKLTRKELARSDMKVYTTLDLSLNDQAAKIAKSHVEELRAQNVSNASVVTLDQHTGAIKVMVGSIDYYDTKNDGEFNVATTGFRQPGSSFKPYTYITAFAQGGSPAQAVADEPTTYITPDSTEKTYTPTNYDRLYHGHMTIRCALQNSLNIPAVRTLNHVGIDNVLKTIDALGIKVAQKRENLGLSMVLGSVDLRLLDHISAFGTFGNGGVHQSYYAVEKIVYANGGETVTHKKTAGKRVFSQQLAYMLTDVLSDNQTRLPQFGDCNPLQLYANSQTDCYYGNRGVVRPAAVKTGTTQDFRDNLTVGYTTDLITGVWVGNNDFSPMQNVTGLTGAAPIWHEVMMLAHKGKKISEFVNPGGLQKATVTYPDGVRTTDWFIPGTVPTFQKVVKPTATATVDKTKTKPGQGAVPSTPYCSNVFNFASPPPQTGTKSPDPGWW